MPRLSIVIPFLGNDQALESTLVSVLENRPRSCEVLVALNGDYADPYQLKDEVRFVQAPPRTGLIDAANAGIAAAASPIVHLLTAGVVVTEGWADAALAHFGDRRVAAVSPAVLVNVNGRQRITSGVRYLAGGARKLDAARDTSETAAAAANLGPTALAGFYQQSALQTLGGKLPVCVGESLADVEFALLLKHAGFRSVFEPASRVYASADIDPPQSAFRQGLLAERLFWRSAPIAGWTKALAMHPLTVAAEFAGNFPWPRAIAQLSGRLVGACQFGSHLRHYRRLSQLRGLVKAEAEVEPTMRLRLDASHSSKRARQPQDDQSGPIKRCG